MISRKELMAYLQTIIEAFNDPDETLKPIAPDVLAFVQWLMPIEEDRAEEYQQAFKAVLGNDPLWIPCMQCEHDGIAFDHVSDPRSKLLVPGQRYRRYLLWGRSAYYKTVSGDRILVGKCQQCSITQSLHLLIIVHALEKRKKVIGELTIPDYIPVEAEF